MIQNCCFKSIREKERRRGESELDLQVMKNSENGNSFSLSFFLSFSFFLSLSLTIKFIDREKYRIFWFLAFQKRCTTNDDSGAIPDMAICVRQPDSFFFLCFCFLLLKKAGRKKERSKEREGERKKKRKEEVLTRQLIDSISFPS